MEKNTMKIEKKTGPLLILLLSAFLLSGCSAPQEQARRQVRAAPADSTEGQQSGSIAKRFQESAPQGPTAVESAIGLSEKYGRLSEEASVLRRENQDFTTKNRQFKEQVTNLEAQLQQAQKELNEANDLLIQMRIELNNWKTDVLGFRDEMRDAEKAQLEALLKILKVLGGEVATEPAQQKETAPLAAELSESKPGQAQVQPPLGLSQKAAAGDSNE
jgi:chromosome segregation ATPase